MAKDDKKLAHCVGILKELYTADALIDITNQYSGLLCSRALYDDPRIAQTKYGPVSKRLAEAIWPIAKFPRDHVANQAPAATEIDRGLRQQVSLKEALSNADQYLNDQERQARERIG